MGAALTLSEGDGMKLAEDADALLAHAASPDVTALLALAERLARGSDGLDRFGGLLLQSLADRIAARALIGGDGAGRWAEVHERIDRLFGRTAALHLDPRQTVLRAAHLLEAAARRGGSL